MKIGTSFAFLETGSLIRTLLLPAMALWSVLSGVTPANGQGCSSCTGDSIFYYPHIRIIGQGKLKVTIGNVITEYTSSDPWMMPTPVEPPAILKEVDTDREKIQLDPDGFVSLKYEIIPTRDQNGDAEFFQAEAGCGTCGMGDGMLLQSHFWECPGWPENCSWTAHEFAPAHHVQEVRFRLRKDEDPANDPGASSSPAPQSSPNPPGPNEMPEIPTTVGQVFSLGRNGTAPVGRVAYKADLTAGSVSRTDFVAQLVTAHAGLVSSIPDPLNAALPKQFKSPQALMVLSDIVVGAASGVKLEYFDPTGAVLEPDGTYTPASAARATFQVYPVSTTIGSATVSGIKVVETRAGRTDSYEYHAEPQAAGQGGLWQEVRNGAATTVVESPLFEADGVTYAGRMVETTSSTLGASTQTTEEFKLFPWGQELVERVEDPNGGARTTTFEYYEGVAATSPYYGKLHLEHCSDGSWHRNIYDASTGGLKAVYRPWVNSPTSLAAIRALGENDCHAEVYSKEVIFESDVPRVTVVEKILGTVIKSTVNTKISGMDYLTGLPVQESETETRLKDGSLAHRQRSGYSGATIFFGGTLAYSVDAAGVLTHYDEEWNLPPGPGETLARRQSIVTQGTLDHPDGVARQQTRTVTISNSEGLIERRTEVALGAGGFAILEKETVERQDAAPQETRRIDGVIVATTTQVSPTVVETTDEVGVVTSSETFPSGELKTVIRNGVRTEYYYSAGMQAVYRHAGTSRPDPAPTDAEKSYTDGLGRVYYRIEKGNSRIAQFAHLESTAGRQEVEEDLFHQEIRTTTYFANGMLASVEGPGVVQEYHTYGVDSASGESWHKVAYGTPLSARWQSTVTDGARRVVREMRPAPQGQGLMTVSHDYNSKGQRIRTVKAGSASAAMLFEYNALGQVFRQGMDVNGNGVLDVHSNEPLTEMLAAYEQADGSWWEVRRQRVYFEDGGARFKESETRRRLGAGPAGRQESIQNGIKSTSQVAVNRSAKTRTTTTSRSDSSNVGVRSEYNGLVTSETTIEQPNQSTLYYYDSLERLSRIRPRDWSDGYIEYGYDAADRVVSEVNIPLLPGFGSTGHLVNNSYSYFNAYDGWMGGLLKNKVSSKGPNMVPAETRYAYNPRGQVTHQWGDGEYPLAHVYDDYDQMVELKTYRTANPALWVGTGSSTPPAAFTTEAASSSTTTWHYEAATGVLLEKEDAAGQSVTYSYGINGSVTQREWARGVTTSYAYNTLGQLTGQTYSDSTPPASFAYHRNGALKTVVDASGTRSVDLDASSGNVSRESTVSTPSGGDLLNGLVLQRSYDAFARPIGLSILNASALGSVGPLVPTITTSYESTRGKLGSVGSGDLTATYQYPNGSTIDQDQRIITRSGMTTTDVYNSMLGHMSTNGMSGRWRRSKYFDTTVPGTLKIRGNDSSVVYWSYAFNLRNEVISADRNQTGAPAAPYSSVSNTAGVPGNLLAGWASTFSYDEIGNRVQASYGYDGAEAGTVDYTTNALNQYTSLGNSPDLFVLGLASSSSAVKVNGVDTVTRTSSSPWGPTPVDYGLPFRQGDYFSARLQADNAAGPDWVSVTVEAGTVTQSGHVYHPPATETLSYDIDGNLTADGRWTYAWDGENRLVSMTTTAAAVLAGVPDLRLTFAYDAQSRRIRKVVEHSVGVGSWQLDSDTRFIYDGWNLLAEVEMRNSSVSGRAKDAPAGVEGPYVRRSYLWGPDVSGTMQGAGGVGGLLAVRRHARGTKAPLNMWTVWDLNGSIIGLHQNTSRSALTANYDYDPFGKLLRASEPEEDLNPFRFSTKYTDAETGLCYYGYRYYDAVRGRWINRDPIEEDGGLNLFGMLANQPLTQIDKLGNGPFLAWDIAMNNSTPWAVGVSASLILQADVPDFMKDWIKKNMTDFGWGRGYGLYFFPDSCEIATFNIRAGTAAGKDSPDYDAGIIAGAAGSLELARFVGAAKRGQANANSFAGPAITLTLEGVPVAFYVGLAPEELREMNDIENTTSSIYYKYRWYGGALSPPRLGTQVTVPGALTTWYFSVDKRLDLSESFESKCACVALAAFLTILP